MGECFLYGQKGEIDIPPKSLSEESWDRINKISQSGKASEYWQVGDKKDIIVNGETLTLVIIGFNHDDLTSGGKAGITFGMKSTMDERRPMNTSNTNSGGFTSTDIYSWLQNTLLLTLPSDLQAVLKSVNKKTSAGSQSSTINTNSMKLFLFSEIEVFGSTTYSIVGEGSQYSYFATAANRLPYSVWWERSPHGGGSVSFCAVNRGNANTSIPSYSQGIRFGFCV